MRKLGSFKNLQYIPIMFSAPRVVSSTEGLMYQDERMIQTLFCLLS